jgi:tRNA 2-thiouridine synthesizing protein A
VSLFEKRRERRRPDPAAAASVPPTAPVPTPALVIDALGRKCPIPIIMAAEQIRDVPVGEIIAVRADDPAAYTDIPAWCGLKSHELAYRQALDHGWEFGIRRQY